MLRVEAVACEISVKNGKVQILRVIEESGATAYTIYYRRDGLPNPDIQIGQLLKDGLTLFGDPVQATSEAMRVVRRLENPVDIQLPTEGQQASLIPGACSKCRTVGRILFEKGSFSFKSADKVLDYKPIRAYCERCKQDTDFVPIPPGVSPYLDKRMSELDGSAS